MLESKKWLDYTNTMKCLLKTIAVLSVLLTSGCAVVVRMPMNHFDTPETIGEKFRFKVTAARASSESIYLTRDMTLRAPNAETPESLAWDPRFNLNAGMSVAENFDLEYKSSGLLGKYQFTGKSRSRAQEGNFSLAATGYVGYETDNLSNTLFGNTYNVRQKEIPVELGVIAGYRPTDNLLLYLASHYRHSSVTGEYSVNGATTGYSGNFSSMTGGFGIEFGTRVAQIILEGVYSHIDAGTLSKNEGNIGLQGVLHFGGPAPEVKTASPHQNKVMNRRDAS